MNETSIPPHIETLLSRIVQNFRETVGDNLVGVYLHGSLVMGCFNPLTSDVDFLAVVRAPLDVPTKRAILAFMLELGKDAPEKGIEFSVMMREHTQHFVFPTPYELHLSPGWHDRAHRDEIDLTSPVTDPDLAAHFTITRAYGRCLFGEPIEAVFGEVPEEHYWASLVYDLEGILQDFSTNPVYSILNLCRIIAYKQEKRVLSKRDGGVWGLAHLDAVYQPLIQQALEVYQAQTPQSVRWDEALMMRFADDGRRLLL